MKISNRIDPDLILYLRLELVRIRTRKLNSVNLKLFFRPSVYNSRHFFIGFVNTVNFYKRLTCSDIGLAHELFRIIIGKIVLIMSLFDV